ncbi:hypothetical protein CYG48_08975 [Neorhizobium sp. SOG26]|uniref:helix-turn-helix domain-containing protein n=1 Tax=Neorhizobium sp. SOG26 TaxID=2060726 RepID=UPI000E96D4F5|nr:hypothetical protein CYG48_08975 [Neorhizobium sp. SOG26]
MLDTRPKPEPRESVSSDRLIGVKEIARILGVCEETVRRYHARGLLPTHQIGGKYSPITSTRTDLRKFVRAKLRKK